MGVTEVSPPSYATNSGECYSHDNHHIASLFPQVQVAPPDLCVPRAFGVKVPQARSEGVLPGALVLLRSRDSK